MSVLRVALDYRPALLGRSGIPRAVRELAAALGASARDGEAVDVRLFGHSWARAHDRPAPPGTRLFRTRLPGRALPFLARLGLGAERLCAGADVFHWTDYVHPPIGRRVPAVLTLHDMPEYRAAALDAGADAFISKQKAGRELAGVIDAATRRSALRVSEGAG